MDNIIDNSRLVKAMKEFKAVQTVIFQENFYKAVVDTVFFVPVMVERGAEAKKNGKYCVLTTSEGKDFLAVFSSPEELKKCYGNREDIIGITHNFAVLREIIVSESNNLAGMIIDSKGENVAILKEEMIPDK